MYNYPNFLNLFLTFAYIPLSFLYILPVSYLGLLGNAIAPDQWDVPKRTFAIMGALDSLAGILQTFAAVYLPGPLLVLLPQAAIPVSMALSGRLLGEKYGGLQYAGAAVVLMGIGAVLEPLVTGRHAPSYVCEAFDDDQYCTLCDAEVTRTGCLSHHLSGEDDPGAGVDATAFLGLFGNGTDDDGGSGDEDDDSLCQWLPYSPSSSSGGSSSILAWSLVMILSCVPMTLSSIYKETALGEQDLDPIFLNGWVALFQFLFSLILAVPAGMASSPPVYPSELPRNLIDGFKCYVGEGSIFGGCHPDDLCETSAPLLVNSYLALNVCYNVLIVCILKFGSSNLLYMAMTVMVPIGNLAFALPFFPGGGTPMHLSDAAGLTVIVMGLATYRFGGDMLSRLKNRRKEESDDDEGALMLREALLDPNDPNVI
mmetsp:Transcript_36313/g.108933  ORF Transcript_36313/g.108933 Transcript_36313/m.108933 type:complete len:426 (-) Transcript_36313:47-1324(-)